MTARYSIGVKLKTHSSSVAEYNGCSGVVVGAVIVERNGVTRVPVSLKLVDGNKESISLKLHNLVCITTGTFSADVRRNQLFHVAVQNGNENEVRKYAVKFRVDVTILSTAGHTAIWRAASFDQVSMIRLLVELGGDVNKCALHSNGSSSPIFAAAYI
jgi:hypothetical protein